jgi:TonB family protein
MFDRLIATQPDGAGARSRRNYFFVSTAAVLTLVLTAVVASIFAEELSLGTDNFELSVLIMPVDPPATKPEPARPKSSAPRTADTSPSEVPTRQVNMARVDEPTIVPQTTATAPNTERARPAYSDFKVTGRDSDSVPTGVDRSSLTGANTAGGGLVASQPAADTKPVNDEPPPVRKPEAPRKPVTQSLGVINGRATSLPKPAYPATALAINAQGKVSVQVLIDETGHVVSARAVSGHPLLRNAAEIAARNARFSPTLLSNVPVKVTGVIVYNFSRG